MSKQSKWASWQQIEAAARIAVKPVIEQPKAAPVNKKETPVIEVVLPDDVEPAEVSVEVQETLPKNKLRKIQK